MEWSCLGHDEQKSYLGRLLKRGSLPHALLFTGPSGVGKRMVAEDICRALTAANHATDFVQLAPERDDDGTLHDIPVARVRDMRSWAFRTPFGSFKAVLIDDAERLGTDAANTLLKLLEEPPSYLRFLLVTSRLPDVLPTIVSRCERVEFRRLDDTTVADVMGDRNTDAADRALLTAVAGGRPGIALTLLERRCLGDVADQIGVLEKALKGGLTARLLAARDVAARDDAPEVAGWWLAWVHSRLAEHPNLAPVAAGLLELTAALEDPSLNRRLALERFFLALS